MSLFNTGCDYCGHDQGTAGYSSPYRYQPEIGSVKVFCSRKCLENYKEKLVSDRSLKSQSKINYKNEISYERELDQDSIVELNKNREKIKEERRDKINFLIDNLSEFVTNQSNENNSENNLSNFSYTVEYSIVNVLCPECNVQITELNKTPADLILTPQIICPNGHKFWSPFFNASLTDLIQTKKLITGQKIYTRVNTFCPKCSNKIELVKGSPEYLITYTSLICQYCNYRFSNPYYSGFFSGFFNFIGNVFRTIINIIIILIISILIVVYINQ